jgi:hypothetical protein
LRDTQKRPAQMRGAFFIDRFGKFPAKQEIKQSGSATFL